MRSLPWTLAFTIAATLSAPACIPLEEGDDGGMDERDDGGGGDGGGDGDGGDGDGKGFRVVDLVDTAGGVARAGVDTVNGIRCTDGDHCAIATRNVEVGGALFVTSDGETLEPVLTSEEVAAAVGFLGEAQFLGIDDTGAGWIARLNLAAPFVLSTGDPSVGSGWSMVEVGTNDSDNGFKMLNNQELLRAGDDGDWLYVYSGAVWHAPSPPGPATSWRGRWSPQRRPPFPADYETRKLVDPTLCDSDPVVAVSPDMSQFGFASADLATVIYPAGGRNQNATDFPGVCLSRDGGATFHQVPFSGMAQGEIGPLAVQCLDPDRCWAFGGVAYDSGPAYVYYSTDASAPAPTWQRATVPSAEDDIEPRALAFAPDGQHGWLVGDDGMAWRSADGGATWTDAGGELTAVAAQVDWTSVFAVDASRVWLGGAGGVLVTGR